MVLNLYPMKTSVLRYLILFSLLLHGAAVLPAQEDTTANWKLEKDKNGIKVFTRVAEGSKFKEYKSETEIEASPEKLLEILLDVEKYPEWMANVDVADILDQEGEENYYIYSMVNVPWPFEDRDEVTLSEVSKDSGSGTITIRIEILPDYIGETKGVVRIPSGKGLWVFKPLENGKTWVYHQFRGDPGGNIPAWIANMFMVDGPYKTMIGLQERATVD
jgi:hypothetical protein